MHATTSTTDTRYWILDISTLRFRRNPSRTAVSVLTREGEIVATVRISGDESDQVVAHRALEAARIDGVVTRRTDAQAQRVRVALYNPFTAEVEAETSAGRAVFSDGPVALPFGGAGAEVLDDVLVGAGHSLAKVVHTPASLTRSLMGFAA